MCPLRLSVAWPDETPDEIVSGDAFFDRVMRKLNTGRDVTYLHALHVAEVVHDAMTGDLRTRLEDYKRALQIEREHADGMDARLAEVERERDEARAVSAVFVLGGGENVTIGDLRGEVEAMRRVVEAAERWRDTPVDQEAILWRRKLLWDAIDEYRPRHPKAGGRDGE